MKIKRKIGKRLASIILTLALLVSGITFFPSEAYAAGWLEYVQELTLGEAVTNSVKDGDYKGKFNASSSVNYFWNVYRFTMEKNGQLNIYCESAAKNYFFAATYFTIYSALNPDNHIWNFNHNNGNEYSYSAARNMYYDSIEIALNKGEYYFAVRTSSVVNTPYYLTLSYKEPFVNVSSISLDPTSLSMEPGSQRTIIPTVLPNNATDKTINWQSNNPSVATVENR